MPKDIFVTAYFEGYCSFKIFLYIGYGELKREEEFCDRFCEFGEHQPRKSLAPLHTLLGKITTMVFLLGALYAHWVSFFCSYNNGLYKDGAFSTGSKLVT